MEHYSQSTTFPTLKERAMEIAEADYRGLLDAEETIDDLSLAELKLEVDSAMALITCLGTVGLGKSEAYQQAFSEYLLEKNPEGGYLLQTLKDHSTDFIFPLVIHNVRTMQTQEDSQTFFGRLECYREAYHTRSPQANDKEKHYDSTEHLLGAGINTAADRIPHALQALRMAAELQKISRKREVEIARKSDHLPMLLAKLSIEDQSRYIDLINEYECLEAVMVKLLPAEHGHVAILDPRLMRKMREVFPEERPEYSHRPHLGCPASVTFEAYDSMITELWHLMVGALEKAGFWDEPDHLDLEALPDPVSSPDTEEGAGSTDQDTPGTEPIAVVHRGAQPTADRTEDSDTQKNH